MLFTLLLIIYAFASYANSPTLNATHQTIGEVWVGEIEFDFLTGLYFFKRGKDVYLRGAMSDSQQMNGRPVHCSLYNRSRSLCASWFPKVKLEVSRDVEEHADCYSLTWSPGLEDYKPHTCFSMADTFWYGGSTFYDQKWPLNKVNLPFQAYRTRNLQYADGEMNTVGSVLDWFWINSNGIAVIFDTSVPLHISVNQSGDKLLCFHSQANPMSDLRYKICKADNLRKIHRYVMSKFAHLPLQLPKDDIFLQPMWTTFPHFHALNQENLLNYSKDVADKELSSSIMLMNDDALSLFDPNPFDKTKFPNSHQSLMYVRSPYGFQPYLAISPFINASTETVDNRKLMKDNHDKPVVVNYSGIKCYVIDLLKKETYDWFVEQLKNIKVQFSMDGFYFAGGDMEILEFKTQDTSSVDSNIIEQFAKKYSSIAERFSTQTVSSFAVQSQSSSSVVLLNSKTSSWTSKGGLKSIIPSVFTLGLLGYPLVAPNCVGGPGIPVTNHTGLGLPDRELYIRWLAVSAYMPVMAFSHPPWLYDSEVLKITRNYIKIHTDLVAPIVIKAAREFEATGLCIHDIKLYIIFNI